ncbi:hypothetical protein DAPPUDRAFT_305249 [Daphnia pulex]|uniref:Uncharacterized protein n=1 Tax=Daphnia pulex TaxID=6669 RepID=E9GQU7_DAPPU|nr:hypothetical protein DAPPUDRAFT_305249 [Daphnia pulex]|eukprot:EFX78267.1 hypothetical protein DAPPUDRAFT_305249 [Daphnia pulex]
MTNLLPLTAGAFVVVFLLSGTGNAQIRFAGRSSRIALPSVPFTDDYLKKSPMIFQAIEILYVPLWELRWQFLEASKKNTRNANEKFLDLCGVLNFFKVEQSYTNRNFPDHFKKMKDLSKAFIQMYAMRTEVSHQSYSVGCFESDAKALVDVAKYLDNLSGRTNVRTTGTETSVESSTTRRSLIGERTRADGGTRGRSPSLIDRSRSGTTSSESLRRTQSSPPSLYSPTFEDKILNALDKRDSRSFGRIDDKCSGRSSKIVECAIDSSPSNSGRPMIG